ncbi:MAG: thiamine pyrophosphate-binding protein [Pseudomonadota bacterium]
MPNKVTLGSYLATRLEQVGVRHYFAIPGDYNLALLDEFLKHPKMQMISCCNELNAGYAADGYARANGVSALIVTYSVGGLSAINAVAGAYAEDLPMIVISGAPNTNSENENQLLHHTLAEVNYTYVRDMFRPITADAVIVHHLADAPVQIDQAIETALRTKKPVYLEIACNIPALEVSAPCKREFNHALASDKVALNDAVEHAASFLNKATKPVLVAGPKLRSWGGINAFQKLAHSSGYPVATMPNAKGFYSEEDSHYIGTYWGPVSSPGCGAVVESSDAYLFAGPIFTDYTTTGNSTLIDPNKLIYAGHRSVKVAGQTYDDVTMPDFLAALAKKIKKNTAAMDAYKRIKGEEPNPRDPKNPKTPISTRLLFTHVQKMLNKNVVIAETGDSWFNAMRLKLPKTTKFEIQMQYGSIGWSVGATLGYELGSKEKRRPIAFIGDGSFQMTAQEISTMIRYNLKPIIFLMNNGGYTIEVEIHDGPYNDIKNWRYADLVNVFGAGEGNGWGCRVTNIAELGAAIAKAKKHDGLCFIEVVLDRNDCNKNLLSWGSRVADNNRRKPAIL